METIIKFENYTKIIKGREILSDINLELRSGNIYKLMGTNGSGKTMLLRAMAGLIYPTTGKLYINETEIKSKCAYPVKQGVLIENPSFWKDYTGFEILKYLSQIQKAISDDEIRESMVKVGLEPEDKRKLSKYSLGMKQKLGIAQAIMEKPDILLLDEPLNALDTESIKRFEDIIKEEKSRGALVVLALHNDGEFEMEYDDIFKIENGRCKEYEK
jgi:ABC-2 type transport system ATP-binding protein